MALIIPPNVMKQLLALPASDARRLLGRLLERLDAIAADTAARHPGVAPLVGLPGVFRVRQGDWRAVFAIEQGDLIIDRVQHRGEVYR
jgi:mRNA interferase RelE/StbE